MIWLLVIAWLTLLSAAVKSGAAIIDWGARCAHWRTA